MAQPLISTTHNAPPGIRQRPASRLRLRAFAPLGTALALLGVWQLVSSAGFVPAFLVPPPAAVLDKFLEVLANGTLAGHVATTLEEMLLGLLLGASIGVGLGYCLAHSHTLEGLLAPLIVAFQATPVVAYAPLLIIWFGTGTGGKIVTCAVVVFFPMLVNTIIGVRNVPAGYHELFRSLRASRWQTLRLLELPAALPVFFAGLRTSATLALIGAVVGEFISARSGLGFMVVLARNQYDTPLVFVGILTMTAIALSLYSLVSFVERRALRWQHSAFGPR